MKMEPSTPRRSTRKSISFSNRSSSHHKESKNPYSGSGLDKFSALLAELDQKRQRIYSQLNPDEISLVRFVFKDSDDCVPIVVKMKKKNNKDVTEQQVERNNKLSPPRKHDSDQENDHKFPLESSNDQDTQVKQQMSEQQRQQKIKKNISRRRFYSFGWSEMSKLSNWRQPSYYLPAVIVLILLFLVFFGRSFAILCTSIGWYIVPTLQSKSSSSSSNNRSSKSSSSNQNVTKTPAVRKEYLRIDTDTKMAAGHKTAAAANHHHHHHHHHQSETTPKKHGHKKSW